MFGQQSKKNSRGIMDELLPAAARPRATVQNAIMLSSLIPRDNSFDCCPNTHETTVSLPNNYSNYYIFTYIKHLTCLFLQTLYTVLLFFNSTCKHTYGIRLVPHIMSCVAFLGRHTIEKICT